MSGIYLHIPFCKQACSYCDFYFVTRTDQSNVFVESLIEEIESYSGTSYVEEPVQTIYIGGGTPSLLSLSQIEQILAALSNTFRLDLEEATLEMNPDDVTTEYLDGLRELGVNRASMGVQSFNPELLTFMNRAHNREEALKCLEILSKSGFQTFTVDLIYGNPGQTLEQLEADIDQLLEFDPVHISAYSLTIEPNTRLGKQVKLGRIIPQEDDEVADHFGLLNTKLGKAGIHRYEVSNYSRAGHEAIHNSNYWQHENYLGMGAGAHSFWWGKAARRWNNKSDLNAYLKDLKNVKQNVEKLTLSQLSEERLMMGLRTREGVSLEELKNRYRYELNERQLSYLEKRADEGKILIDDFIKLTDKGIVIADAIILDLITLH